LGVFFRSSLEGIFRFVSQGEDINAFPRDSIFPFNGGPMNGVMGTIELKKGGGGGVMNAFVFGGVANSYLGYLFPTRATNIIIIMLMGLT